MENLVRLKRPDLRESGAADAKKQKMAGGKTRYVAQSAGGELKKLLTLAIKAARLTFSQQGSRGPFEDEKKESEDSDSDEVVKAATFKKRPIITVHVHGHKLVMLNVLTPMYLRADINTQQFLSEVFLTCINNAVEKITTAETKPTAAEPIRAKFQFADDACPLVQGKIH